MPSQTLIADFYDLAVQVFFLIDKGFIFVVKSCSLTSAFNFFCKK